MLGGLWEKELRDWSKTGHDTRPPVFILVCKNTKIAKIIYEWLAEDKTPTGIPSAGIDGFRNKNGQINTIRVDSLSYPGFDGHRNKGNIHTEVSGAKTRKVPKRIQAGSRALVDGGWKPGVADRHAAGG